MRLLSVAALAFVLLVIPPRPAAAKRSCDRTASPSTLDRNIAAAKPGQTICLKTGDYGTWTGTDKRITLRRARGSWPRMDVDLGPGDSGFTLDGMRRMGGTARGAHDFTIRNSTFTDPMDIEATRAHILLDHNRHDWNARYDGGLNAKLFVWTSSDGANSGVTVRRSTFRNGDLDGIHIGAEAGMNIIRNRFENLCDEGTNHTDNIQTEGMNGGRIAGNLIRADYSCATQGLTSYDGGTNGVLIEDNVIDIRRPFGIEWYSDRNSIIRHNTVRYYPDSRCFFNGLKCGQIDINRKDEDPAGSGTQVYDNLTTDVSFSNGSSGTAYNNVSGRRARFVGPLNKYRGFRLSRKSRVGRRRASDKLDVGARIRAPRARRSAAVLASDESSAATIGWVWEPPLLAAAFLATASMIRGVF